MLKAIFFDMDGVISNTQKYHIISWRKAFAKYGLKLKKLEVALLEGMSYAETTDLVCERYNLNLSLKEKNELIKYREKVMDKVFRLKLFDIKRDLDKLKQKGLKLALVTGSNRHTIHKVLDENFPNIFDEIVSGDDVKHGKPSIEPYKKAFEKFNFKKHEVLVVENAPLGILSAKNFGLTVFALTTTLPKKYLSGADKIFRSHKRLFKEVLGKV